METRKLIGAAALLALPALVLVATGGDGADERSRSTNRTAAACVLESGPHRMPADVRESSGIARTADGSLWTHNDGEAAVLYRLNEAGAIEQIVRVDGVNALDIEDIDGGPCPDGSGDCLWLADTGDNDRQRPRVALLAVPVPAAGAAAVSAVTLPFEYPQGPRDGEALAVLPSGAALVVTKGRDGPVDVYRVARDAAGPSLRADRLVRLAGVPESNRDRVTGAAASEDGAWIAMRSNDDLAIYRADALQAGDIEPVLTHDLRPLRESQGEGVEIAADGTVWLTSEGERGSPTLARVRCPLPVD